MESNTQSNLKMPTTVKSARGDPKSSRGKQSDGSESSRRENMQESETNRPLKFNSHKSKHKRLDQSNNKTEQNILDPYDIEIKELPDAENDYENLDDDYNDKERIRQFMNEGGE